MDWLKRQVIEFFTGKLSGGQIRRAARAALIAALMAFTISMGWTLPQSAIPAIVDAIFPPVAVATVTPTPTPTATPTAKRK